MKRQETVTITFTWADIKAALCDKFGVDFTGFIRELSADAYPLDSDIVVTLEKTT